MGNDSPGGPNDPISEFESLEDFTKKAAESGDLPPLPDSGESSMQLAPIEAISEFESIDAYTKSHPDEIAKEQPFEMSPEGDSSEAVTEVGNDPFAVNVPDASAAPSSGLEGLTGLSGMTGLGDKSDTGALSAFDGGQGVMPAHDFSDLSGARTGIIGDIPLGESGSAEIQAANIAQMIPAPESPDVEHLMVDAPPEPTHEVPKQPAQAPVPSMETVRKYSEEARNFSAVTASANLPFTVFIEGKLEDDERARLVDIVNREKLGVTELDLEPQFAAGKILIPRVSEYAAVLILSQLRSVKGKMRMGLSEEMNLETAPVSQTQGAVEVNPMLSAFTGPGGKDESIHPAEILPVTAAEVLPGFGPFHVVDAVTATASLKIPHGRIEFSPEFRDLSEKLKAELQFKAYRKGANGIIHFSIQVVPLSDPTVFRLLAAGSAIRSGADATFPKALDLPASSRDTRRTKAPAPAQETRKSRSFEPPHPEDMATQPTKRTSTLTQNPIGSSSPSWTPTVPDPTDADFPRPTPLDPSVQSAVDQAQLAMHDPTLASGLSMDADAALSIAPPGDLPPPLPEPPGSPTQDDHESSLLLQMSLDDEAPKKS